MNVFTHVVGARFDGSIGHIGIMMQYRKAEPSLNTWNWLKEIAGKRRSSRQILAAIYNGFWVEIMQSDIPGSYFVRQLPDDTLPQFNSPETGCKNYNSGTLPQDVLQSGLCCLFVFDPAIDYNERNMIP